jgi:hypothetical protein
MRATVTHRGDAQTPNCDTNASGGPARGGGTSVQGYDFCVMVSMAHLLGDAHTFYTVAQGLGVCSDTPAMQPARRHLDVTTAATWRPWNPWKALREMILWQATMSGWMHNAMKGGPLVYRAYQVDNTWLAAQKALWSKAGEAEDSSSLPAFVSTNDVLTSWFFTTGGCVMLPPVEVSGFACVA